MRSQEIITELIKTWESSKDRYTPSYYIYDSMSSLYNHYLDFCNKDSLISMFNYYIEQVKDNMPLKDFDDINPGPLFYLQSDDEKQVWLFLEIQYVEAHKSMFSFPEM